jgi:EAL domain-containing protein (putative c-di-GMP-specific phosphodiesterase class I)
VYYQPIVELATDDLVGFEALARWRHLGGSLVPPAGLLPHAEQMGFIDGLVRHVGGAACLQLAKWQRRVVVGCGLWVGVKVSASGFKHPMLADDVAEVVDASGIKASDLVLEITETILMEHVEYALVQLKRLKRLGVRLALHNFGTGFSSLSCLREFPFDIVKLDTSFASELPKSIRARQLAGAIHKLVSALGMQGVAEGVDRPEQARILRDIGWEFAQGFLYSRPVEPTTATNMLCLEAQAAAKGSGRHWP